MVRVDTDRPVAPTGCQEKTRVGRKERYTVQQCAVTLMDKHAATHMHYLLVEIQTMTHRCVSATAYSLSIVVLVYDFVYIARVLIFVSLHFTTYVPLLFSVSII